MRPSRTLLAYLAGTIDADGFVTVQRTRKRDSRCKRASIYYTAKVGLSETSPIVPNLLRRAFGGQIYEHQPRNRAHKKWFVWQVSNEMAAAAIRSLLPYFKVKRKQAEFAIQLASLVSRQWRTIRKTQKPPYRITEAMNFRRRALWAAVTQLNAPRNRRVHFLDTA